MFALVLTICITGGNCYTSEPMRFDSLQSCMTQLQFLRTSGQVGKNVMACRSN